MSALPRVNLSASWEVGTQRRQRLLLFLLALLGSAGCAALVLRYELLPFVGLLGLLVVGAILWQPRLGLYLAIGLVACFEINSADPLMLPGRILFNPMSGIVPFELLIALVLVSWLARGLATHSLDYRGGRLGWLLGLFFLTVLFGLVRGQAGGGSAYHALYEVRYLLLMFACYVLAANTIRTPEDVRTLMVALFVGAGLAGFDGIYRFVFLISPGGYAQEIDSAWGHDSVIFYVGLILITLAQQVLGAPGRVRTICRIMLVPVLFTLLVSQRRAGFIALIIVFIVYGIVFFVTHRKAFRKVMLPIIVLSMLYLPAFWNNNSPLGQPARAVRSLVSPSSRDANSNFYRVLETINVRATILSSPALGVGFGREFLFVVPMPDLSVWPFWHYEPHNSIMWVWLKTGVVGFTLFLSLMGTAIALAANLARRLTEPTLRTFALLALCVVIASLVFCWVDIGMYSSRLHVFWGTALGTLAVLERIARERTAEAPTPSRRRAPLSAIVQVQEP